MKRRHFAIIALALLLAAPFYWLMVEGEPDPVAPAAIDLAELRELADGMPGERPVRIDGLVTAVWGKSGNLLAAGTGFRASQLSATGYVVGYSDGPPVVIDTGLTRAGAAARKADFFSAERRETLDKAIANARAIVVTSADGDHLGALTGRADLAPLAERLLLGENQRSAMELTGWPQESRERIRLAPLDRPIAVAPGVVRIPAPGARPDRAMVYVRLANGREVLFAGDNAVTYSAMQRGTLPARLFSNWIDPIDRAGASRWILGLRRFRDRHPNVTIVTGHDAGTAKSEFRNARGALGTIHFGLEEEGMFEAI